MNAYSHSIFPGATLPEARHAEISGQLDGNEQIVGWMEGDLDANLHFTPYLLLISNTRILCKADNETGWHEWHYRKGFTLERHDHAGIGSLELFDG